MPALAVLGAGPKGIAIAAKARALASAGPAAPQHPIRHGQYAGWVDRGRLRPTHREWSGYPREVAGRGAAGVVRGEVTGLDAAGLRATLGPSPLTLGGLLKHLALVEDEYFTRRLPGGELGTPWTTADWTADPDWEWHSAARDSPAQLMGLWQRAVTCSRAAVAEALAEGGLDGLASSTSAQGEPPSLRRILIDLTEEYARHAGHADLIRESVDGLTGEEA